MPEEPLPMLVVIPAFSAWLSQPGLYLRIVHEQPLLEWTLSFVNTSRDFARKVVLTDDQIVAEFSQSLGFEAILTAPESVITQSGQPDLAGLAALTLKMFPNAATVAFVDPLLPVRTPHLLDNMLQDLIRHPSAQVVRSITPIAAVPSRLCVMGADHILADLPSSIRPVNLYAYDDCLIIVRNLSTYLSQQYAATLGYPVQSQRRIASELDLIPAEQQLMLQEALTTDKKLTIVCDIDGILASKPKGLDYGTAGPIPENIALINALYDRGHQINLFTARGTMTGINWEPTTRQQMQAWGVRYHSLTLGKPAADIYIDDKFYNLFQLQTLVQGKDHSDEAH